MKYKLIKEVRRAQGNVLYQPDANDVKTIEKLHEEPMAVITLSREDCEDYVVDRTTGELIYPVKTLTINATQWHLRPGENKVPASVYEFYHECLAAAALAARKNARLQNAAHLNQLL